MVQYSNTDPFNGRALLEGYPGGRYGTEPPSDLFHRKWMPYMPCLICAPIIPSYEEGRRSCDRVRLSFPDQQPGMLRRL